MKKPKKKSRRPWETWCVWVKYPLRYVNARSRGEARLRYLNLFRRFPEDLAVIESRRAKAMGLAGS
jgi:hypothetical protein